VTESPDQPFSAEFTIEPLQALMAWLIASVAAGTLILLVGRRARR
jgi:hypothetical protein